MEPKRPKGGGGHPTQLFEHGGQRAEKVLTNAYADLSHLVIVKFRGTPAHRVLFCLRWEINDHVLHYIPVLKITGSYSFGLVVNYQLFKLLIRRGRYISSALG